MADYHFHPTLLLRAPVYSYHLYTDTDLAEILKQPFFQKALYFASEIFYNELKKFDFDLALLDKKAMETVRKYFNRMCFRPTPFGLCSAFGALEWGNEGESVEFSQRNLRPFIQFSYAKNREYAARLLADPGASAVYKANPSIYKSGSEARFLRSNQENVQIDFIIDSIQTDRFFDKMIAFVTHGSPLSEITAYVIKHAECTFAEATTYINWLINNQVIINVLEVNITGQDYLDRLLLQEQVHYSTTYAAIKNINDQVKTIHSTQDVEIIPTALSDNLKSGEFYVNLEINLPDSKLDSVHQQAITDGLKCLDYLIGNNDSPVLNDFTRKFQQKFEHRAISLLTALDPEIGVGYSDLAIEQDNINIVKNIIGASSGGDRAANIKWSKVHTLLFDKWQAMEPGSNTIILTDDDLKTLKKDEEATSPTISVIFRVAGDKVFIESAGGVCASSLIGRFTPFNKQIHQLATDMAAKEALYNPEVLFAEIAHICHSHTANIDRREHIYPYEIPVMVQSTVADDNQIAISDLMVAILEGQVMLLSKKHGKRVIPRLSSAFNYTRNDLTVFRFLCDLQRTGIKTNLNLDLSHFFPGLDFYPRIEHKNAILQLAYWNIKTERLYHIFKSKPEDKQSLFTDFKQKINLPNHVALTQHDHQLVFDLNNPTDVSFLLDTIKGQPQITLKEFLLPDNQTSVVKNDQGEPYINQFIASLYHAQAIYKPVNFQAGEAKKHRRKIIPGSEWLYFKLYCHPVRSNELLKDCLFKMLKQPTFKKLISEYFFIRYNDPDYHIRLRLKVQPEKHQQVLVAMYKAVRQYVADGIINKYSIDTYERELERYSPEFMDEFEDAFYASSNLVLSFLNKAPEPMEAKDVLQFAVVSVSDILATLGLEGKPMVAFLDKVSNSFQQEFIGINELKYQLDIEFRSHKQNMESAMADVTAYYTNLKLNKARQSFNNSMTDLQNNMADKKAVWHPKWVTDLIHMHLNRLFVNDSRKQEMAVYYFLLKYERSRQARLVKLNG